MFFRLRACWHQPFQSWMITGLPSIVSLMTFVA